MIYKDESEYKTPLTKRERDEQWRLDHPGYHSKYNKEYRKSKKQNILYMVMIDDEYYFGHTSQGMDARIGTHLSRCRNDRPAGNPRMRELYKQLGEDEFMNRLTFKVLKSFDTLADAQAAEKLMLKIYVGQKECMNKRK